MTKIVTGKMRKHSKAVEVYIDVEFHFSKNKVFLTSIPLLYRRTGTEILSDDIENYLLKISEEVDPANWDNWKSEQTEFWKTKPKANTTKSFFDALSSSFDWCCVSCDFPINPNWAKRIQDIKEFGYTLATDTNRSCLKCNNKSTQLILVPIRRGGITGYEVWNPKLRSKIISLLNGIDVYEAKAGRKEGLLPDHKFPEIRWDAHTRRQSLELLSDEDLKSDFQLLTNQRNQQKREVCRKCYQTGNRGIIYGIPFFYAGTNIWSEDTPKQGKSAENGCIGCGWYDIDKWRNELTKKVNK